MKRKHLCALVLSSALLLGLAGCGGGSSSVSVAGSAAPASSTSSGATSTGSPAPASAGDTDYKVALLTSGPVNDNDWNALAYNGLKLIEENYGVQIGNVDSVTQSDQEEVMRSFIDEGYNVIYGHGYEFGDTMKKLADEFPEVKFVITSADLVNGSNLAACNVNALEHGFVAGAAAALVSDAGHVSMIGSMEIPPIVAGIEGFKLGAKYVNPDIQVESDLIGSFDDAAKMKELMTTYINKGVDVGCFNADMAAMGGIEALVAANKLCVGLNFNQGELAPNNVVTSIGQSYPKAMNDVFTHIVNGTFEGINYNEGVATDAISLIPNPEYEVPADVQKGIDDILTKIRNGEIEELKAE